MVAVADGPAAADEVEETTTNVESRWRIAKWLDSQNVSEAIAQTLLPQLAQADAPEVDELAFVRSLAKSGATGDEAGAAAVQQLLEANGCIASLANKIWQGVSELDAAGAATAEELQGKFLSDGAGVLSYAGLETFFGGLEGQVGAPSPKVREAMAAEHSERPDSLVDFTTSNYSVTTTSEVEWRFVAEPKNAPANGWPTEAKLLLAAAPNASKSAGKGSRGLGWGRVSKTDANDGSRRRRTMPMEHLMLRVTQRSGQLASMGEPPITLEEGIGARLYTGPLVGLTRSNPLTHTPSPVVLTYVTADGHWCDPIAPYAPTVRQVQCRAARAQQ